MLTMQERDRRWTALREAASARGMGALVVFGHGEGRPTFQYVTGVQKVVGNFVLPVDTAPVGLTNRPIGRGWVLQSGWVGDVRAVLDAPSTIDGILEERGLGKATIGVAGHPASFPVDEMAVLRAAMPDARFEDASGLISAISMIKSAEEVEAFREISEIMRQAFSAMEAMMVPGVTERAAVAEHTRVIRELGGYDGYCVVSRPPWSSAGMPTDAPLRRDESFSIYSEQLGPSGYWCEVSHQYSFGPPPEAAHRMYAMRVAAYDACLAITRPGSTTGDLQSTLERVYHEHGYDAEGMISYHVHGMGTGGDQPPFVPPLAPEDHIALAEGMVLSLHPHVNFKGTEHDAAVPRSGPCDNVLVTSSGGVPMTDARPQWIELTV